MTRKVYRTAQGKLVDLGRLQLQNENTRAVGNMGVNARGDLLDSRNQPIERRSTAVQKQYNRQTATAAADEPVRVKSRPRTTPPADIPAPPEDFQDDFVKDEPVSTPTPTSTGLAAAIARAREIKQEPLRTPQQVAQQQEGVRKL